MTPLEGIKRILWLIVIGLIIMVLYEFISPLTGLGFMFGLCYGKTLALQDEIKRLKKENQKC